MAVAIGRGLLFGTGEESTYGTTVAIDRRHGLLNESLSLAKTTLQSNTIGVGLHRYRRGALRVDNTRGGGGDVAMEVAKTGMGRWFEHAIGGTPTITQQAATTAYLQTFETGSLAGKSLTVQKAFRDNAGTVIDTFTLPGCKITSWSMSVQDGQVPQFTFTLDARNTVTTVSSATLAGLADPAPTSIWSYMDASLTVNASSVARVMSAQINVDNSLRTDAFGIGTSGLKYEPDENDYRNATGSLTFELEATTLYDLYDADTGVAFVLTLTGNVIEGAYSEELVLTIPQIHFTGDTPQASGAGLIEVTAPFETSFDDTNNPLSLTYQSTDTAI